MVRTAFQARLPLQRRAAGPGTSQEIDLATDSSLKSLGVTSVTGVSAGNNEDGSALAGVGLVNLYGELCFIFILRWPDAFPSPTFFLEAFTYFEVNLA